MADESATVTPMESKQHNGRSSASHTSQSDLIVKATEALRFNVQATVDAGDDWTDEVEHAQHEGLSAAARAGYDWEDDAELVRFCLKATQLECATETLRRFQVWAQRRAEVNQLTDDLVAQENFNAAEADDFAQCMNDLMDQEGL